MTRLLFTRFLRSCRENLLRYIALLLMTASVVTVITSLETTAYTITQGRASHADTECIEDGQFTTLFPIADEKLTELSEEYKVTIQKSYSVDIQTGDVLYRIFRPRKTIDTLVLHSGAEVSDDSEIVIEQNFADIHGIVCGDTVMVGARIYTVCGTGALPDYVHVTRHRSDMAVTSDTFCWVMVSDNEFDRLLDESENQTEYTYSYLLTDDTDLSEFSNAVYALYGNQSVVSFVERVSNHRMDIEMNYAVLYRNAGWIAGVLLIAMLVFIFATVTRSQVRNEHGIIGSLYALGLPKRTLMLMYILPGIAVALLGGILGMIIGNLPFISDISMRAFHKENSFPYYEYARPAILYIYAFAMPPFISLAVNTAVLNRTLSRPALSLLRGTYEKRKNPNIRLGNMPFIRAFQLRRLIEERGNLAAFFSILISVSLLMLALTTLALIDNNEYMEREYTPYNTLCVIKNAQDDLETAGEKLLIREMNTSCHGKNITFSLIGLPEDSTLFNIHPSENTECVIAGEAIATKLGLKTGGSVTMREGAAGTQYVLTVSDIVPSGAELALYMNIDSLRKLLGASENYYNVIAFEGEPDIDPSLIYSVTKTEDVLEGIDSMRRATSSFIWLVSISSLLIFVTTLYLVVSTMIDRAAPGISLLRVFGFRFGEIQRMYVNSVVYTVVLALIFAIPAAKLFCDRFSPIVYSYLSVGMFFDLPFWYYAAIFAAALILFLLILLVLMGRVRRIPTSIVLKSGE